MRTQLVSFLTSDEIVLNGAIFEPDKKSKKIAIFVHGSAWNFFDVPFVKVLASTLCFEDVAFLAFNHRGSGVKTLFKTASNQNKTFGFENDLMEYGELDIDGAVSFCKQLGYEQITLIGHSTGAIKIANYLLKYDFAGKVVLLSPFDVASVRTAKCKESIQQKWNYVEDVVSGLKTSRKTFNSIWADGSSGDIFKLRSLLLNKYLKTLLNKTLVCLPENDMCLSNLDIDEVKNYFECQFKNSKVKIIKKCSHNFVENMEDLSKEVGSFLA